MILINLKKWLVLTCAAALAAGVFGVGSVASAKAERPNILLFLVDNLGCGKLGCYGQEVIRSRTLTGWPAKACRMNKLIERNL